MEQVPRAHPTATAALALLARQLGVAQQITHIGSWEWDAHSGALTWSDELYRIYGLEPQSRAITFEFFMSCLHPDDRQRIHGQVAESLASGGRFHYPERILRPDGSLRHLDTVGEAVRDEQGAVTGLIGTCRDVTDERRRDETIELYRHIVESIQIGLMVLRVEDPADVRAATLVACNPAAERAVDLDLAGRLDARLGDLLPELADGELGRLVAAVAQDNLVRQVEDQPRERGSSARIFSVKAFPLPGACVGVAIEDVTVTARARILRATEQRVLEMIASSAPLEEVLTTLALLIEEHAPPAIASILLIEDDAGTGRIRQAAAPHLPAAYSRAIDGVAIGPNAGSCGTAAYLRQPVFVTDIEVDPRWTDYRELALGFGLRACWSTPIFASDGRVLGTFAMYYRERRSAAPEDLEVIARASHLAGQAIERRQLDGQLRALSAHIEAAREQERTGIAREIHDVVGQSLTALKIDLAWLARHGGAESLSARTAEMSHRIDDLIGTIRRISAELRPGELDDLGLVAALEWQAEEFERRTDIRCAMHSNLGRAELDRNLATTVFRIAQEALTNVARHAGARQVAMRLERADGRLRFELRDDGRGISSEATHHPRSLGLLGMRERARALGGTATIAAAAPRGTVVEVDLPFGAST